MFKAVNSVKLEIISLTLIDLIICLIFILVFQTRETPIPL